MRRISYTYNGMYVVAVPYMKINKDEYVLMCKNPCLVMKEAKRLNYALGVCFKPYKDFLR